MFRGIQDLVVCEDSIGNVTLKLAESMAGSIMRIIKHEVSQRGIVKKLGGAVTKSTLTDLKNRFAYEQYGGAMLSGSMAFAPFCTALSGRRPSTTVSVRPPNSVPKVSWARLMRMLLS